MNFTASFKRNPFFVLGLFFVAVSGLWVVQPTSSVSAAYCGVHTNNKNSFAGAIIESVWVPYGGGAPQQSNNTQVRVWNADGRGDSDPDGNIYHFRIVNGNSIQIPGSGVDNAVFAQYASGCAMGGGDNYNAVLGYSVSSTRVDVGPIAGPWALDCDASQFGVGNERIFGFSGVGVPSGARAGGTWVPVYSRTPNGDTTYITVTYYEPAPPDAAPVGVVDVAACNLVQGWAFDPDNSGISLSIHVYIDGAWFGAFPANQPRGDVNAAYGIGGNHGYSFDISSRVSNGGAHTVDVYAIGINSGGAANGVNPRLGSRVVGPCYNYTLTPSVSTPTTTAVVGQPLTFTYQMSNVGSSPSQNTAVAIKQYVVAPGQTFNTGVGILDNVTTNCDARYGPLCVTNSYQLPARVFPLGVTAVNTTGSSPAYVAINTAALSPGTKVCQILAIDPASQNPSGAQISGRWSAPVCVVMAKKPYLAIKNGDAWAGGLFKSATGTCPVTSARGFEGTNNTFPDGQTYGSYSEYGLMSLRSVTNFGSAGKPLGTKQTFRNTPPPVGYFSPATDNCLNDALAHYGTKAVNLTISGSAPLAGLGSGVYATTVGDTGLVTVSTGNPTIVIGAGTHIVLIATGDILINKNIEFAPGPYTNLADIPSLTIISRTGSIRVAQNVTRLDGFYQANKQFITCQEGVGAGALGENDNLCKEQLTVNGAVTAAEIIARRIYGGATSGGVDQRNDPAEQFIMRPDVFLSQYGQAQSTGQLRAVDENELPPRY